MNIQGYKEINYINHRMIFGMFSLTEIRCNPDQAAKEMEILIKHARLNPKEYRNARAEFRHHKKMYPRSKHYEELIGFLSKLESKYGSRSLTFQYMLEAVSIVELSSKKITAQYKNHPVPPAYDDLMRSPLSIPESDKRNENENKISRKGKEIRTQVIDWIKNTNDPVIVKIKEILHNPREYTDKEGKTRLKPKKYSVVHNGSSSGISLNTLKILDIEAQCFKFPECDEYSFDAISDYFGVLNFSSEDDCLYLMIPNQFKGALGVHTVVPDKDGKMREVYFILACLSAVGKGIVDILDLLMRDMPGIYTYEQQSWIENMIELGWNKNGTIVTIDMEKFSDTIVRKYFMSLLIALGIPLKVVREIDVLFSFEIWDRILDKNLGVHQVVLQGQYAVFMLMSLLNLCLQRYMLHYIDGLKVSELSDGESSLMSAVLGDDTAMRFISKNVPYIFESIKDIYGSFGMMINELKSDSLIDGQGQGDFAKTHFDGIGIIDHMNPKNVERKNIDGIINDILALHISYETKLKFLTYLFDKKAADNIMGLSIINGGPSDHPICEADLNYLKNNIMKLNMKVKESSRLEEELVIRKIQEMYHQLGATLIDSPLRYHVPKKLWDEAKNMLVQDQEELIITCVLNADTIGMEPNYDLINQAIGYLPSELKTAHQNIKKFGRAKDDEEKKRNTIWNALKVYDSFVAKRKMSQKGFYSELFLPCINGDISIMERSSIEVPVLQIKNIKSMEDYYDKVLIYQVDKIKKILRESGYELSRSTWGYNAYNVYGYLIKCLNEDSEYRGKRYRLYSVVKGSIYTLAPEGFFNELLPVLKRNGVNNIDYKEFISMWEKQSLAVRRVAAHDK